MLRNCIILVAVSLGLSACNATNGPTNSKFVTPTSSGDILGRTDEFQSKSGTGSSPTTGNVYGYKIGVVDGNGMQGFAGIAPGATVSEPLAGGSATMTGIFRVGTIQGVSETSTTVSGRASDDIGELTLVADFDAGTLIGSGTGVVAGPINPDLNGNVLEIDGRLEGSELTGTAIYDGVSGPLKGLVGGNEAIGAFHGHTDSAVHAGGFFVN